MAQAVIQEQRREARTELSWPVSVWLPEANRFFNARATNIARGGVFVLVPMTAPMRIGQIVELNFPRSINLAKKKGQFARIKSGKVVRVDRELLTEGANIGVGVQFV